MKLTSLVYAGVGYVLGARAGRDRYEQIVRVSRRFAGSQTVQSTAGVVQAQVDQLAAHAKQALTERLGSAVPHRNGHSTGDVGANGYQAGSRATGTNGFQR